MKDDAKKSDFEEIEVKDFSEDQQKLEKLTKKELAILETIESWLIKHRGYKDYDFTDEFRVSRLMPLIKLVEHKEVEFIDDGNPKIVHHLRVPVEMRNKANEVTKKITQLHYKPRYQSFELKTYAKGIDIQKDTYDYIDAQIAMLTDTARGIIGKLWDTDSNNTKHIYNIYFLA